LLKRDGRAADRAGRALRATVFDKLTEALGGRRRLVLAPDGELVHVPFEVLPLEDGRRLLDHYTVNYVSTGHDVLRFGAPLGASAAEPVVVADLDFDLGGRPPTAPAPQS